MRTRPINADNSKSGRQPQPARHRHRRGLARVEGDGQVVEHHVTFGQREVVHHRAACHLAIASEVFVRFAQVLTDVEQTEDPVADFFAMAAAYREFALANPQRYHLIFGTASPTSITGYRTDLTETGNPTIVPNGPCHSKRCETSCAA